MDREPTGEELTLHFLELERVIERAERSTTHYQVLGLERSATGADIGLAHRRTMSLLNPPDFRHSALPASMTTRIRVTMDKVVKAYIVLNNFGSRVEYNNSLVHRAPVPIPFDFGRLTEKRPNAPPAVPRPPSPQPILQDEPASLSTLAQNAAPAVAQQSTFFARPLAEAESKETIDIKYTSARALFTKPVEDFKDGNKRRYQRMKLSIPTYVTGYDQAQGKWTEVAHTLDVSIGGVALQVAKEMPEGAVVHLTIPMPTKLRRHGYSDPTYKVYAIVRRVESYDDHQRIIGLEFLGASPPAGYLQKPWARFQTKF